jgi:YVTN family beta-propeller protein
VNTADNRLEVFDIATGGARLVSSIPVGGDPVSVRARTDTEAWVVNHISDSVSVVNVATGNVVKTIHTEDEPADVVFAGTPQRAFVSCSQANSVLVFDPSGSGSPVARIAIEGEDPRAMAVNDTASFAVRTIARRWKGWAPHFTPEHVRSSSPQTVAAATARECACGSGNSSGLQQI